MFPTIILLRHGESADKQTGQTDFDRILTVRGSQSITQLGVYLNSEKIFPEIILASPATRTTQTVQEMFRVLNNPKPTIIYDPILYHGYDDDYRNSISRILNSIKVLMVVGHNPSISSLVGSLTGNYSKALRPGEAAFIQLNDSKLKLKSESGSLEKFVGPLIN